MSYARESKRPVRSGSRVRNAFASTVLAAACASPAAAAGDILAAPQLGARVNGGAFEFRGMASIGSGAYLENHIWRFSPDGKVSGVGTIGRIWYFGGYTDQPLPPSSGTWRRSPARPSFEPRTTPSSRR